MHRQAFQYCQDVLGVDDSLTTYGSLIFCAIVKVLTSYTFESTGSAILTSMAHRICAVSIEQEEADNCLTSGHLRAQNRVSQSVWLVNQPKQTDWNA